MIQIAILSLLLGAVFGIRFKIPSLLLLNGMGFLAIGAVFIFFDLSLLNFVVAILTSTILTQAGYLLGSYSRFTVAAARSAVRVEDQLQSKSPR